MPGRIDIKAESFPWQAKFIGILLAIGGLGSLASLWWLSVILFVLALFLLTGHSGTTLSPQAKTYREYHSYLFIRHGKTMPYHHVEKIYVNASKESQKMYTAHTMESSTFTDNVFNAYMKFDDGTKIFLTSRKNKAKLLRLLEPVARALGTALIDNTPH